MTRRLLVVGLNHGTASVEVRERLALDGPVLPTALAEVLQGAGLTEALILSTCNRVEVWGVEREEDAAPGIAGWLSRRGGLPPAELADLLYQRRGTEALLHMTEVAAGLDSMIVGEPQILGQVREAHGAAAAHGSAGPVLGEAVGHALRIARRVRVETDVGRGAVSVSYAAVELARKIFGDLPARTVLLVGAGEMGALAARHLTDLGVSRLFITSRTIERAEATARQTGGKAIPYQEFPRHATTADILICAATAPGFLVTRKDVEGWVAARPRPLFVIDLGVPRNVEGAARHVPDVYLYDIDALEGVAEANRRARREAAERASTLIAEALRRLEQRQAGRTAAPTIVALRARIEEIRQGEVARAMGRLRDAPPEARAVVDAMSVALVNKILHGPIEQLKAAQADSGGHRLRNLVRDLFGLGQEDRLEDEPEETGDSS